MARKANAAWRDFDRKQAAAETRWQGAITKAINAQIRPFVVFMKDQGTQAALREIDNLVKPEPILNVLNTLYRKEFPRYAADRYNAFQAEYGKELATEKAFGFGIGQSWLDMLKNYVLEFVANKVVRITDTTKQHIRNSVENGIEAGQSVDEMARAMMNDQVNISRGRVISRTETVSIMNAANSAAITKMAILMEDIWLTARDNRVREKHRIMEGERVIHGQPFSNGLYYPGDPAGEADQVIQCRCTTMQEAVRDAFGRLIKVPATR